jgi:hypothetical protein
MIRIRLSHGDRRVEIDAESGSVAAAADSARNLWAIVIAAGPTDPKADEPPRIEAGGMGFTADLADQRTYPRPAPDLVPGVTGDPQWDPEDDRRALCPPGCDLPVPPGTRITNPQGRHVHEMPPPA